jgi:hypothetical protein
MISLIPRTLMNLLVAVYEDELNPKDLIMNQLVCPYYFTYQQLELVIDDIYWPGRFHASSKHPSYSILKQLDTYLKSDSQAMVDGNVIKRHFVYAATSICHAWYTRRDKDGFYILHKNPHFVAYQEPGLSVPFIWLSIDSHGMAQVFQRDKWMPPLEINLFRTTKNGDLFPLKFFARLEDEKTTNRVSIDFCIYEQRFLNIDVKLNPHQGNFILFISEGLKFTRSILVSPSCEKTWSVPVVIHKYE